MDMFEENNALLLIDIQNDFCPGGALAVDDGDKIIEISNKLQEKFKINIITQDWHPPFHKSFASNHLNKIPFSTAEMFYGTQVLWPNHCIQGSIGAEFHPKLVTKKADLIIWEIDKIEEVSYLVDSTPIRNVLKNGSEVFTA